MNDLIKQCLLAAEEARAEAIREGAVLEDVTLELLFERAPAVAPKIAPLKTKLTMSRINTVLIGPNDTGFGHLKDKVYGVRNESPIIAALLDLLGVPEDGTPYKIRNGFMKYDKASKMLFIAKFKDDLPGVKVAHV